MRPLKGREVQGWKNNNAKMFSHSLHRRNPVHLPGIEVRTGSIVTPMTQPAVSLTMPGKSEYAHTHTHTHTHTQTCTSHNKHTGLGSLLVKTLKKCSWVFCLRDGKASWEQ